MGDRWEARLSVMENIQENFEYNLREMEGQLTRLTNLFEDMVVHPRGLSPLPHQQVPRPSVQTMSYPPHGTDRPNLRQPRPTAPPVFVATSRHADQSSGSRENLTDKRRSGEERTNGIQSSSLMLSYFQI